MNDLFDYALRDVNDSDMVGIIIQNEVKLLDKPIGISFRRKDQLSDGVIWSVFSKVVRRGFAPGNTADPSPLV